MVQWGATGTVLVARFFYATGTVLVARFFYTGDIMEMTGLKKEEIEDIRKSMLHESKEDAI